MVSLGGEPRGRGEEGTFLRIKLRNAGEGRVWGMSLGFR
jgi:hypothetical protein